MNVMTTVRSYLDFTERDILHRYGKQSARYQSFKKTTGEAYDNSFSYRFLYKLRNYVQHCGMPIGKMELSMKFADDGPQTISQSIEFAFSRESLLSNFDSWGSPVKSELAGLPDYFPIRPHIAEMMEYLDKIQLSQLVANSPTLLESLQWLDRLLLEASWRGGLPCICTRNPSLDSEEDFTVGIEYSPLELMDMLRKPFHRVFGPTTEQFFA